MAEYFRIPGLTLKFDDFRDEATNTYLEYPSYDYEYPHKIWKKRMWILNIINTHDHEYRIL